MSKKHPSQKKSKPSNNQSKKRVPPTSEVTEVASGVAVDPEMHAAGAAKPEVVKASKTKHVRAEAPPDPEGPCKQGKATKAVTLGDVAAGYLGELELRASSSATLFSYELELQAALEELGKDRLAAEVSAEEVGAFFGSARVTRKKSGGEKSPLSIAKTCRVLRQALVWAVQQGLLQTAPLPEGTPAG